MIGENNTSASQTTSFHAKSINIENMDDCYLVIFYNIGEYFLLQKAYDFDEKDQQNGMNTYHIEYCDQSQSLYGGIDSIVLYRNKVDIELNEEAAKQLKINKKLSIGFTLNDENYKNLEIQLKNIFTDDKCLSVEVTKEVIIDYTNWRGERNFRTILPVETFFGLNEFHPGEQWLLKAIDVEKNVERVFSMKEIHSWTPKN